MTKKLVGHIGVDAGLCWIGDPCYVMSDDATERDQVRNWSEFCDSLDFNGSGPLMKSFNYKMGHEGLGVCVETGYGDGTYPVYAEIEGGRIKSVTVEFF